MAESRAPLHDITIIEVEEVCPDLASLIALDPARLVQNTADQVDCIAAMGRPDIEDLGLTCGPSAAEFEAPRGSWTQVVVDGERWGTMCGDGTDYAFPTPRTWAMLNRKLPHMTDDFYGCASLIGDGPAGEYLSYRAIYKDMPDIDQIIEKPSTSTVPTDTSILFAVSGALAARAGKDNFDSIMRFVRRMPAEYQVITVRDSIAKQQDLVTLDCFTKWTTDNAAVLL